MSEANQNGNAAATSGASANPASATSGVQADTSADQGAVSREAYSKLLKEKQNYQKKAEADEARLAEYEQSKLEAEGKLKEALDNQKKMTLDSQSKYTTLFQTVASKTMKQQFLRKAENLGCVDPDLAYLATDFSDIEISKDLEFDEQKLSEKIEMLAKQKPLLFKKDVKMPNDLTPNSSGAQGGKASLKKMTDEELKQLI